MTEPLLVETGPALEAAGLVHAVRRPEGNAEGPHPCLVLIHGLGGDENVMWIFERTAPNASRWLAVAPRAILDGGDGGYSWHPPVPEAAWPALEAFDPAVEALARFLDSLPKLYQADPQRIYLMGFSQGAASALALAERKPGRVQGIAALMGFLPKGDDQAARGLAGLPVYMAAGLQDPRIPIEVARDSAERLRAAGARLDYHEYETGHKMNAPALKDLKDWWITLG